MSSTAIAEGLQPSGPKHRSKRRHAVVVAIVLFTIYVLVIWHNFHESARRTVSLAIPSHTSDYMSMGVNVVNVDLSRLEMTTRISFSVAGALAQDEVTPATDLQIVLNTVRGQQQINFPKGKRMNTIEAVFPLQGEINRYPLDQYKGSIWLLATIPEQQRSPAVKPQTKAKTISAPESKVAEMAPEKKGGLLGVFSRGKKRQQKPSQEAVRNETPKKPEPVLPAETSGLGAAAMTERVQADTKMNFTASIPGLTFGGTESVEGVESLKGLTGIQVRLQRSPTVISISVLATLMMLALSIGVVTMTWRVLSGSRQMASFHAPMAVSLIFGLPALRNIQPGIPPPGTFGDMLAFTWAEMAAAGSVFALVIHWLINRPPHSGSK